MTDDQRLSAEAEDRIAYMPQYLRSQKQLIPEVAEMLENTAIDLESLIAELATLRRQLDGMQQVYETQTTAIERLEKALEAADVLADNFDALAVIAEQIVEARQISDRAVDQAAEALTDYIDERWEQEGQPRDFAITNLAESYRAARAATHEARVPGDEENG